MKSTRQAFGEALLSLGSSSDIICLDADLSKSTMTEAFAKKYPERHLQMGLQEANMIGVAAGLARGGKRPIVCSFACFLTGRFDQIRMSIAYNELPVILIGTHSGLGVGEDGYSQMALEDLALMRSLPKMTIFQPSEPSEVLPCLKEALRLKTPSYLRLTRQALSTFEQNPNPFILRQLKKGSKIALIGTGSTLQELYSLKNSYSLYALSQIKPLPDLSSLSSYEKIFLAEDHTLLGGVGSMILDTYPYLRSRLIIHGIKDVFGESATAKELYQKHQLDSLNLEKIIRLT